MLHEANLAKQYLIEKFGSPENVKAGEYAIPVKTSKGDAFMKVVVNDKGNLYDFRLFKDEALTESWYTKI